MTMRGKQTLERVQLESKEKIRDNHAFFRENQALDYNLEKMPYAVMHFKAF